MGDWDKTEHNLTTKYVFNYYKILQMYPVRKSTKGVDITIEVNICR